MMRAVLNVVRGEGVASAFRRARERVAEAAEDAVWLRGGSGAPIVNVGSVAARTGGVAVQLRARLRAERALRKVAVARELPAAARAIHLEGTAGVPLNEVCRLLEAGVKVVVSVHDFSLVSAPPDLARRLLESAAGLIFCSRFLLDRHRDLFALALPSAEVIEPSSPNAGRAPAYPPGPAVAYAGAVKPHKGGHLLPEIAHLLAARGMNLHVFGGGDAGLLLPLRKLPNVAVHGYYRSGTLPALFAKHGVGLALLPSVVAESYSLTLSEAWRAGVPVAAFDLGAPAERIRREGGGWLVPIESGAAGLVEAVERWRSGSVTVAVPRVETSAEAAAREHLRLYREWGLLP